MNRDNAPLIAVIGLAVAIILMSGGRGCSVNHAHNHNPQRHDHYLHFTPPWKNSK